MIMPNFYTEIDEKFDELIEKVKVNDNKILIEEIISLKSFIYDMYMKGNEFENLYIKRELTKIDLYI
jgi:hypothetical protein